MVISSPLNDTPFDGLIVAKPFFKSINSDNMPPSELISMIGKPFCEPTLPKPCMVFVLACRNTICSPPTSQPWPEDGPQNTSVTACAVDVPKYRTPIIAVVINRALCLIFLFPIYSRNSSLRVGFSGLIAPPGYPEFPDGIYSSCQDFSEDELTDLVSLLLLY